MSHSQIFHLTLLQPQDYLRNNLSTKNINQLSYTILAGSAVCMRLKIQNSAYRLLKSANNQQCHQMVLIQKQENILSNETKASFNLISNYGNKVTLNRINLAITNVNNQLLPFIPVAAQLYLYIHPQSQFHQIIKNILSSSSYIISTKRQQVYINLTWLKNKQFLKHEIQKIFLQCRRLIAQNTTKKYTNYLKLNIKAIPQHQNQQKYNTCLFVPNKTKIVLQKALHYDINQITKIITLPQIYQLQFQLSTYKKLHRQLIKNIQQKPDKKIILLKIVQGMGISSFIHQAVQDNQYNFVRINCKYFVSQKQLLEKIRKYDSNKSTVIFIKNIQWLLEVGSQKNDQHQKMKRIIRDLEDVFMNLGKETLTSQILIIGFKGNIVKFDMVKNANLVYFQMDKQQRNESLKIVAQYYQKQKHIQLMEVDDVVNFASNSLGWVTFAKILSRMKENTKQVNQDKISADLVLKQIGKLVNMEKVENIKNVTWDDVGGLESAKQQIIQTILLPTKHPQIFDQWIKPRTGLLFFGPPGTGKTLLGKCIANQCKMGFISVKGPQLLNMYIGQSEKNVREVFERAAASKPCIVFMDELDALIPKRGQSSDSNQVMDRIVSQLLTQMDKAPSRGIFIIGATNRPDLLDPSILRPGRFDKQIYLGITKQKQSRIQILKAQTRHIKLCQNFNYERVIENVPVNFTGADFYGLTSRSITKAAQRFIIQYQNKQKNQSDEVVISQEDFIQTAKQMKPSVSLQQLNHYQKLKQQYQ